MDANDGLAVRVGVAQFPDGWNVVADLRVGDRERREVYNPTFATEAEAEAKANELRTELRRAGTVLRRAGTVLRRAGKESR